MGAEKGAIPSRCSEYASVRGKGKKIGASHTPRRRCLSRPASQAKIQVFNSGSPKSFGSSRVSRRTNGYVAAQASTVKPRTTRIASTAGLEKLRRRIFELQTL